MTGSNDDHGATRRRARAKKQALKALDFIKRSAKGKPLPALPKLDPEEPGAESIRDPRFTPRAEGRGPLE